MRSKVFRAVLPWTPAMPFYFGTFPSANLSTPPDKGRGGALTLPFLPARKTLFPLKLRLQCLFFCLASPKCLSFSYHTVLGRVAMWVLGMFRHMAEDTWIQCGINNKNDLLISIKWLIQPMSELAYQYIHNPLTSFSESISFDADPDIIHTNVGVI